MLSELGIFGLPALQGKTKKGVREFKEDLYKVQIASTSQIKRKDGLGTVEDAFVKVTLLT
jgi:hypothetical protein